VSTKLRKQNVSQPNGFDLEFAQIMLMLLPPLPIFHTLFLFHNCLASILAIFRPLIMILNTPILARPLHNTLSSLSQKFNSFLREMVNNQEVNPQKSAITATYKKVKQAHDVRKT
jgi:hypothetical protein